ncbi:hypothetical protein [Aliarcobacter cryaerophilus]|jgi:hypothetical protein|uniref:hypothetical protein n=1 Tax=Aliarcobacter cryaerophilus TaxID=28198 RepID=UPI00112F6CC7|nr:hypothetical protein [Aliarcobacter cryaerophilus]MBP7227213.1 hypothetical protein [Aliarcobacter sp.]
MISLSDLKLIFDGTLSMLKAIKENNNHNNVEYEVALLAIYTATTETKNYISSLGKRKKHAKEKERQLSELWIKAGVKLRNIDNDLAQRCIIKADYWANPDEWTMADIKNSKITLDEIIKESRELM